MAARGIAEPREQDLPPGPHRDLVLAVHQLYRAAGFPSLRAVADAIRDGDYPSLVNHQLVSEFLSGRTLTTLPKVQSLVMCLADWLTPPGDRTEVNARATALWQHAMATRIRRSGSSATRQSAGADRSNPATAAPVPPLVPIRARPGDHALLAQALADLKDAQTAHGGLPIEEVERLALDLVEQLHFVFHAQIALTGLPIQATKMPLDCTFGDLAFRVPSGNNALKVQGTNQKPFVRIEMTPIIGISRDRSAEHTFVIFDANVHRGDALMLTLVQVQDPTLGDPGGVLDRWVEAKLSASIAMITHATRAAVAGER